MNKLYLYIFLIITGIIFYIILNNIRKFTIGASYSTTTKNIITGKITDDGNKTYLQVKVFDLSSELDSQPNTEDMYYYYSTSLESYLRKTKVYGTGILPLLPIYLGEVRIQISPGPSVLSIDYVIRWLAERHDFYNN